jgi:hypothetical protein
VLLRASLGESYAQVLEGADAFEVMRRGEEAVEQNILLWEAFNTAVFILASSLIYGASAYVYRALTAKSPWEADPLRPPAAGD